MKIAQIAPIAERVPPKKYGGTERVIYNLTEELIKKGHEVTLFATSDSLTSANLKSVVSKGLREVGEKDPHGINPWTLLHIGAAYREQEEFDIIHDHNSPISLPSANNAKIPVVMTIHSPMTEINKRLYSVLRKPNLVAISSHQFAQTAGLNFVGTVYNGLDFKNYSLGENPEDYLLFVGRASREKGLHLAIEAAKRLGMKLIIVAKVDEVDLEYFEKAVKPNLSKKIIWVGEVDEITKIELYKKARAFLHLVTWPEPFGLTMIEAMATGTPIIALREGSVPEIVMEGISGYVADSIEKVIESIKMVDKIDRKEVRDYSLKNFNSQLMANSYERIYQQILSSSNISKGPSQNQLPLLLGSSTVYGQKPGNSSRYSSFGKR